MYKLIIIIIFLLSGCSDKYQKEWARNKNHQLLRDNAGYHQKVRYRKNVAALRKRVRLKWGNNDEVSSKSRLVKYSNHYKSRAIIDFKTRKILVETTDITTPKKSLKKAIVATLLTPKDPTTVDLFSDKEMSFKGEPFLYNDILDNEKKPIRWKWRAEKYSNYLIAHKLKVKNIKKE